MYKVHSTKLWISHPIPLFIAQEEVATLWVPSDEASMYNSRRRTSRDGVPPCCFHFSDKGKLRLVP